MPRRRRKKQSPVNPVELNVKISPYVGDCRRCRLILMASDGGADGYLCPRCDTVTAKNKLVKHTNPHEVDMVEWSEDAQERNDDVKQVHAVIEPDELGVYVGCEDTVR